MAMVATRRRVLVTGGSGTIGRAVVSELLTRGHSVRSLDLVQTARLPGLAAADVLEGSTADPHCVAAAIEGCDTVVHLAAVSDEADFLSMLLDANVKAVYNVLHSARQSGARVILASSTRAVSGMLHGEHHQEGTTLEVEAGVAPKDHYGLTKVWAESMAEMYAREYRMSVVSVRIGWCVRDTGEAIELARKGGKPEFLSHADAGRFFALAVESARPDPSAGDPAAVVFLTSKPPPGQPPPVDPEPAFNLCGYRGQDVFPAGLPFPVLDPEHDPGAVIDTAALETAWERTHTLATDPGCSGFSKDTNIVVEVPPDESQAPAPDHRWLGFAYEYTGVRGKEPAGEPDVQIGPATRSGLWRCITPNVIELPTRERRYRLYYTQSGPTRDYNTPEGVPHSPGYVLSSLSDDGMVWHPEEGVRVQPHDGASLRAICPDVVVTPPSPSRRAGFRMYYEAQGHSGPSTIRSAFSYDAKDFTPEQSSETAPPLLGDPGGSVVYGSPRCVYLEDGRARLYAHRSTGTAGEGTIVCVEEEIGAQRQDGPPVFGTAETVCIRQELPEESVTVYAPEVVRFPLPGGSGSGGGYGWRMYYAGWGGPPTRGYILSATSHDGLVWTKDVEKVVQPGGAWDRVKCSEPCVFALPPEKDGGGGGGGYRLLYEACDGSAAGETGVWRVLGATKRPTDSAAAARL